MLLQNSTKVIIMDGLLENRTIEYLLFFRKTDTFLSIYNTYRPKENHTVVFKMYKNTLDKDHIANKVLELLTQGLKIVMMVTSKDTAKILDFVFKNAGFKSTAYHGDNAELEEVKGNEDDQMMT